MQKKIKTWIALPRMRRHISLSKKVKVDEVDVSLKGEDGTVFAGRKKDNFLKLRFLDSYKVLVQGLASMVSTLTDQDLKITSKFFSPKEVELVKRKGILPYDHFDSLKRLKETNLPDKDSFYSRLNDEIISEADYEHAKNVWNFFKMTKFREYHDLYLKTDVLLLADCRTSHL